MKTKEELYKFYGVKEGIKYEVTAVSEEYSMEILSQKVGAIFIVEDKRVKFIEDEIYYKMGVLSEYKYRAYKPNVKDKLTTEEREYLSAVIKPFREKIICIIKYRDDQENQNLEYISIRYRRIGCSGELYFPQFKANTMYKGMQLDKMYSLEDLGL